MQKDAARSSIAAFGSYRKISRHVATLDRLTNIGGEVRRQMPLDPMEFTADYNRIPILKKQDKCLSPSHNRYTLILLSFDMLSHSISIGIN